MSSKKVRNVPLGATPDDDGTSFAVFSGGEAVEVCVLDPDGHEQRTPMTRRTDGVWQGRVEGVGAGTTYGFRVHGPWDPWHGHRYNPDKLLLDPYARAIDGPLVLDGAAFGHAGAETDNPAPDDTVRDDRDSAPYVPKGVIVKDQFDWGDDVPPQVSGADTVLYEAHVRGLTKGHPALPEQLRGTYAGLAHPAVIEHLVSLGVTTVELLPVHEFVSEPFLLRTGRANYWGYNSIGFFAPHGAYSSAGTRGGQVGEFKAMVRALHAAGLEVVLDVVYNHTGEGDATGPTLCWRGLDNHAYYRLLQGRRYRDFTGCGNSLDLRHPRCLAMVADSLRYWVSEMHVDGFRFDLAPTLARDSDAYDARSAFLAVLGQDPLLSQVKLIAEPWDVGPGGYQLGHFPPPWAEWNDRFRDTVRNTWLADPGHQARHASHRGSGVRDLAYALAGSSDVFQGNLFHGYGRGPLASVNFLTAHDGFTLRDLVTYNHKHNEANGENNRDGSDSNRSWNHGVEGPTDDPEITALRHRQQRNLLTTLLVSTGVPMLSAGDEAGRTQGGNNNAYSHDDEKIWVSWEHDGWQRDLLAWVRALTRLRAEHPVLRQDEFFEGRPDHDGGLKDIGWFAPNGVEMAPETWFDHDQRALGCYLSADCLSVGANRLPEGAAGPPGSGHDDPDAISLMVLMNTGPATEDFTLPGLPWATAYDTLLDTVTNLPTPGEARLPAGTEIALAAHSMQVLAVNR